MKLAMTLMVRDEADIVATMIDYHLGQGVDVFIVTDNGSVDGTAEILADYAARGLIELRHDPVQRKQQSSVVTAMARDAFTLHAADWVVNADADEFFVPVDRSRTLHEVFSEIPVEYGSFGLRVINLTGAPAASGTGLQRLVHRDERSQDELAAAGIIAHPSPDSVHVGSPDVVVAQGNHEVSIESLGAPAAELSIEVLHLPWRSWEQYRGKVEAAGRAYESNPELRPSPNHHGMRDYARLQRGTLLPYYLLRHPSAEELAEGLATGSFVEDRHLAELLTGARADVPFEPETLHEYENFLAPARVAGRALGDSRRESRLALTARDERVHELEHELGLVIADRDRLAAEVEHWRSRTAAVEHEADELRARKAVRLVESVSRLRHRGS